MGYPGAAVVTGTISLSDITDTYATHWDILGLGGHRSVDTIADRNAIPVLRRKFGMTVTVTSDPTPTNNKTYQLQNVNLGGTNNTLSDNNNWNEFNSGSSFTLTNGNGTTANGTAVDLGGSVTSDTSITATAGNSISIIGSSGTRITSLGLDQEIANTSQLQMVAIDIADGQNISFQLGAGPVGPESLFAKFTDGRTTKIGITYAANYSAGFTARSLVDKEYVDTAIAGVGGITNSAGINELTKSDGTNLVGSGITVNSGEVLQSVNAASSLIGYRIENQDTSLGAGGGFTVSYDTIAEPSGMRVSLTNTGVGTEATTLSFDLIIAGSLATPVTIRGYETNIHSLNTEITTTTINLTLTDLHYTVLVNATSGNITITLPAASGCSGRMYVIKKIDSSVNTVTIDPNGAETIDGAATLVIPVQYDSFTIQSNGTSWFII